MVMSCESSLAVLLAHSGTFLFEENPASLMKSMKVIQPIAPHAQLQIPYDSTASTKACEFSARCFEDLWSGHVGAQK